MKPTQGKCQGCAHYMPIVAWCEAIEDKVRPWWTGCIRWIAPQTHKNAL